MSGTTASKFTENFYSPGKVAELLGVTRDRIKWCCERGYIPFAKRLGGEWIIGREGAEFIAVWLARRDELGSFWRGFVASAAAKLDKDCVARQPATVANIDFDDVLDIRARRVAGESLSQIAGRYGCDPSTISYIDSGRSKPLSKRAIKMVEQIRALARHPKSA